MVLSSLKLNEGVGFYMHFGCCVLQQGYLVRRVSRESEVEHNLYCEQPTRNRVLAEDIRRRR